jgi:hypothetical protein
MLMETDALLISAMPVHLNTLVDNQSFNHFVIKNKNRLALTAKT